MTELSEESWDRVVDVNLKGALSVIGCVLPTMLEQKTGHIVNVGSVAGRRPFPAGSIYSATKFAVRALTAGASNFSGTNRSMSWRSRCIASG